MKTRASAAVEVEHNAPESLPPDQAQASTTAVDKPGIVALACASLALGGVVRIGSSTGYSWLTPSMFLAGFGGGAAVLVWLRLATGSLSRSHLRGLVSVWTHPARPRLMFLFGCLVALPVLALHTSVISGDADSSRLVASILYVQEFGLQYLVETQEVLLPHLILGPILALGGISLAKLLLITSVIGLAGVVSYITWQITGSAPAALAATLALLSFDAIDERAYFLPMYAPMLAFGFFGCYLAYRSADQVRRRDQIRYAVLAAASLILSIESHQVGQLFLIAAPILLMFHRSRRRWLTLSITYGAFALFYVPRAVINLTEGGFSYFLTNRDDFWIRQGYLVEIQKRFWRLVNESSLGEYLAESVEGLFKIVGWPGTLTIVLAGAAIFLARRRVLWFGLTFAAVFAALAIERRLPFYSRYFSQLLVGAAIAAGVAVEAMHRRKGILRIVGTTSIILLGAAAGITLIMRVDRVDGLEAAVLRGPYPRIAAAVSDDQGVVGVRSTYLNFTSTDVLGYGGQFLTESEFVTFLTWPSDHAVIEMMRRRDIGWVLVPQRRHRWVYRYNNIWLGSTYGRQAVYPRAVRGSASFCRVLTDKGALLYRLSAPEGGERVTPGRWCSP